MLIPRSSPTAPGKGTLILIMDAQTVDETKSTVVAPSPSIKNHTFTIKASAAITGALQLETSDDWEYTGVWSPLGGGPIDLSTLGAGELQLNFSQIAAPFLRARISTVVAGGTVSVSYVGN